jgi:hypothetical protein
MVKIINAFKFLVGRTEVKKPLGCTRRWGSNIKINLKEIVNEVNWIYLAQPAPSTSILTI